MPRPTQWLRPLPRVFVRSFAAWWLLGIFLVAAAAPADSGDVETLNRIVFVDFFAAFITALLVPLLRTGQPWKDRSIFEKLAGVACEGVVLAVGGWLLHDLGGWIVAGPWVVGIAAHWHTPERIAQRSWIRAAWSFGSAFLAAFFASICGADLETALTSNPRGVLAWGLIYFGAIAVVESAVAYREKGNSIHS